MKAYFNSINLKEVRNDFVKGVSSPFKSVRRTLATLLLAVLVFSATVLSSYPEYSIQMLQSSFFNWPVAVIFRFRSTLLTSGTVGASLTVLFSILVAITITNTATQLRMNRVSKDTLGAVPGFLVAGCASCGVGILSILGLGGILASLPFEGNLLRLGSVLLLAVLIVRTGDPETCELRKFF